jgi:protein-S-isoprenylcysteine O-methyltransferase Ste14
MIDGVLCRLVLIFLLFAAQHSLTVSDVFKDFVIRIAGAGFYAKRFRLLFTLWNLLLLSPLLYYWRGLPDWHLFTPATGLKWTLRLLQGLGLCVFYLAGKEIDLLHFVGIRQWREAEKGKFNVEEHLITKGIYRQLRHPLYLGSMLILWGEPHLLQTRNGLLLILLCTAYFFVGSILEEKRMVRQFGDEYRRYRKKTGRFIPHPSLSFYADNRGRK